MISRLANRVPDTTVTKTDGTSVKLKFLNFLGSGIRLLRYDEQAVGAPTVNVTFGDVLTRGTDKLLVANVYKDYYKGAAIRQNVIMVTADNTVTVKRPGIGKDAQGGITGHTETTLYTAVPCKAGTLTAFDNAKIDETVLRFVVLIPCTCAVQKGDMLEFSSKFAPAKIEGIKYDTPGLLELIFDKEPRWTSL